MVDYQEIGDGEPLVVLHGAPTVPASIQAFVDLFSEERRVVVPELYGLGQSADAVLPSLMAALRRADADGAPILGHSFGAYRAFQLAVQSVFDVERVAAVGPMALQPEGRLSEYEEIASELGSVDEMVPIAEEMWFSEEYRASHDVTDRLQRWFDEIGTEGIISALEVETRGPDLRPALGDVDRPVRLVVGSEDAVTPVEWAEEIHEILPNSELFVVQGSGHFPHLEEPEQTLPIVEDFLG